PDISPVRGASDDVAVPIKLPASRRDGRRSRKGTPSNVHVTRKVTLPADHWPLAASVLALTGFATLTYEIAWTRVFALTAGPSTYAFAATLATVIAGIAIGSVIGAASASQTKSPALILTITLILTAAAAAWAGSLAGSTLPRAFAASLAKAPLDFASLQWQRTWLMAA